MAPAAVDSQDSRWSEEQESNVELELASSSGNGSEAAAEGVASGDQGWQKVTNPKKQRQREKAKLLKEGAGGGGLGQDARNAASGDGGVESRAFEAMEKEAEARRARRKSKHDAWIASNATAATANGVHHGSEDDEQSDGGGEFEDRRHVNGGVNGELKKKPKKLKKPKVSIAAAAAAIDTVDLTAYLADSESLLPDIQLIHCVDYFVRVFSAVSTQVSWDKISKDPLQKSIQMPIQDLPENVCKITSNWLAQRPVNASSEFALWALNDVLLDPQVQQKGGKHANLPTASDKTKVAVLVVLALLLRRKPEALLTVAETLRGPRYQGPAKLYILTWMYGQVAQGDLLAGLSLWVQNLLPLAVGTVSTPYSRDIALQFFESIILSGDIKKTRATLLSGASRKERLVPPSALNAVLHMAYPSDQSRTKATDRFVALYPTVKEVALGGSSRSRALKTVAQQLLPLALNAAAEDVPALSREGCCLFRWCLFQTPDCYKQWEKLHLERLKGSTRVLQYIREEWKESESLLSPLNDLKSTIGALRIQHRKLLDRKDKLEPEVRKADEHCRVLQKRMSRFSSCVKASATVACALAAGYVFYLLNPNVNPWNWDGKVLLSNTHAFL